jgi:hypothetical protein
MTHYKIEVNARDADSVEAVAESFQQARKGLLNNPRKNAGKIDLINQSEGLIIPGGLYGELPLPASVVSSATYSADGDADLEVFLEELMATLETVAAPHVIVTRC